MEKQTGSLRLIIIILAVIIGLLVIVVTVMIFKLKAAYEDGYDEYGDDDDEEDDEDMDDLKYLVSKGINVYAHDVPGDPKFAIE